ncbi:hypothetical protein [Sulfitobacter donghicola]|uniref:Uncharacterized protein n=1 Tax=Sulfitobacter donghicola DSW-25 = KCTC 12864 = JCM 14565 TaxID=1300350 RepID=A0A073ILI2_9RHOB|nr:hypothetical protein [Sulfitobacter donghicola]KEJ90584.1 hypothetical protein DSW25_01325 [Sulfitobacter donghicola DSW-25 = KCTC 12864 = JCM 14565]KIN67831.1 hypothetical protein Z948_1553 [Sulfitobacter donghicola DSW-25 = KCTC 12864 = JCM 14565]
MRFFLPLLFIAIAVAAGAGPHDGRYRPDHPSGDSWDCKSIGKDGGAILLTSNLFFAVGSRCTLRDPVAVSGMDAVLYDAICRADGAPWHRRIMIMKTENGISVIQKGGRISMLRKCE